MSERNLTMSLDELMSDRFGKYSKYIIQDRALPDVRDGLKPVRRRILYSMYKEGNISGRPYRKSAKTVGNVIGNYHPHGDASVYDAMVRMSQEWKTRAPLVDMQGNNGSIDNDPAAAMRYTEARLSGIASELLEGIDRDAVEMAPNFDDTEYEPTVLPSGFPNLLVNGSTGIAAGYATNIPPHNMNEVIDAVIYRIEHPRCSADELAEYIKGPDFPTGGIVEGKDDIMKALKTGKGKVAVYARAEIVKQRSVSRIVISEIPYEVNKASLVKKMDDIRVSGVVDGIGEVRDESDRSGLRIVVDLRKGADAATILNYLYSNTDLQKNYNYNMVAIKDRKPVQLGIDGILDGYINHRRDVVARRSRFDLKKAKERKHIVEGLVRAISILDDVVNTVKCSRNKTDAIRNLQKEYGFSRKQSESIVVLQLYRLTNTDVSSLEKELKQLTGTIDRLNGILKDSSELDHVIISELKSVRKKYPMPRLTEIRDQKRDMSYNIDNITASRNVFVSVTRDGYVKCFSKLSDDPGDLWMKSGDKLIGIHRCLTTDRLFAFTDTGRYMTIPVRMLEKSSARSSEKHISYLIDIDSGEKIVSSFVSGDFEPASCIAVVTADGMAKRVRADKLDNSFHKDPSSCISLKDGDKVIAASLCSDNSNILLLSAGGYGTRYHADDISIQGFAGRGVKAMNLVSDTVVFSHPVDPRPEGSIIIVGSQAVVKHIMVSDVPLHKRPARGLKMFAQSEKVSEVVFACLNSDNLVLNISDSRGRSVSISSESLSCLKPSDEAIPIEGISDVSEVRASFLKKGSES